MPKQQHLLDQLSDDIAEWIETMSSDVVNALTEGGIAPFAANVDNKEKLSYFTAQVYLPDGSINVPGRNQLMQTYGPDGYAAIMRSVLKSMGGLPPIPNGAVVPAGMGVTLGTGAPAAPISLPAGPQPAIGANLPSIPSPTSTGMVPSTGPGG